LCLSPNGVLNLIENPHNELQSLKIDMPPNSRFVTTGNLDTADHPVIPGQTLELNESKAILFPIKVQIRSFRQTGRVIAGHSEPKIRIQR